MGPGEEVKTRPDPRVEIQERGEIFFFYRPKVSKEEAHSADDVQRLYIVLRPESGQRPVEEKQDSGSGKEGQIKKQHSGHDESGDEVGRGSEEVNIEEQPLLRFIVMGRKSLPEPGKKGRPYWGFVEMVTTKIDDVKAALQGEEYDTATRGHRRRAPARALAEGVYRILRHQPAGGSRRPHTHLVYKLEFPPPSGAHEPQESLHVEREASLLIQIKNPEAGPGLKGKRRAAFPAGLQGLFGRLRFRPADPPDYLNYQGCEFLLIGAADDVEEELGLELRTEAEAAWADESCSDLLRTFGDVVGSVKPLLSGTWA